MLSFMKCMKDLLYRWRCVRLCNAMVAVSQLVRFDQAVIQRQMTLYMAFNEACYGLAAWLRECSVMPGCIQVKQLYLT